MTDHRDITAVISYTDNSVIACCESDDISCVGYDEFEAIMRLRTMVNERYGNIFPDDLFNS